MLVVLFAPVLLICFISPQWWLPLHHSWQNYILFLFPVLFVAFSPTQNKDRFPSPILHLYFASLIFVAFNVMPVPGIPFSPSILWTPPFSRHHPMQDLSFYLFPFTIKGLINFPDKVVIYFVLIIFCTPSVLSTLEKPKAAWWSSFF